MNQSPQSRFDWIAYLFPVGMLLAPLAYYYDHHLSMQSLHVAGSSVSVKECEQAARDRSLVISVDYPKEGEKKASLDPQAVDPKVCLPN